MITRVEKPWGHEIIFACTDRYAGKILSIRAGERLSFQYHRAKDESIYVLSGRLDLLVEEDGRLVKVELTAGQGRRIPPGTRHRMIAVTDCEVAEASTPELSDVVRLEDAYGRVGAEPAKSGARRP
jgi:mannose-6-phosphate isomerase